MVGSRYLTGSDQTVNRKKEVIIVIKADLLPTLEERVDMVEKQNVIKEELKKHQEELDKISPKPKYIDKFNK